MALSPGVRLGPYEIQSPLGAGGMGEVYRARDTRLDRTVAIKILPQALAADAQFRNRFDREARTISQLDHPHICALYDVGVQDGMSYLVLQYLDGETLDRRLERGRLKLDEALRIAIQIADALDRAHRDGIIHRDLKPANVMLTKAAGGPQAKLLDFGLAKTAAASIGGATTMMPTGPSLTAQGTILGTFQYMAPEQLEGRDADARTDLFAFGALVYEMITGRKAFDGRSHASLIASIIERDPPSLSSLQPSSPAALDHVVGKCLAKNPDDRWQSARDVMSELSWLATDAPRTVVAAPAPDPSPPARAQRRTSYLLAGIGGGLAVGAAITFLLRPAPPAGLVARAFVTTAPADHLQSLATDQTVNEGRPSRPPVVWSPDGRWIVFSAAKDGRQQLYLRGIDQLDAKPIDGTEDAANPTFSPDSAWIAFATPKALKKVPIGGGPPTTIRDSPGRIFGASWGDDGAIVYSLERAGLWSVPAAGGTPKALAVPDRKKGELKFLLPHVLPGSRGVLFTVTHTPIPKWDDTEVVVLELPGGQRRTVMNAAADGRYVVSGHLIFMQRGTLMAAPFDLSKLRVTGGAIGVVAGVMQAANTTNEAFDSGAGMFAASSTGSLVYVPGGIFPDAERSLVWVSRSGAEEMLPMPVRAYLSPRLSPDGGRIVLWTQGDRNIWIYDLPRQSMMRINVDGRNARSLWSPDGKRIAFSTTAGSTEENAVLFSADGTGTADRLVTCECPSHAAAWTPDGRTIVGVENHASYDITLIDVGGNHRVTLLLHGTANENYPDISPDGRWIAYASDESGRAEVYVQPFPNLGLRHQISTNGGTAPAWSHNGRELFYTTTATLGGQASVTKMMAVSVTTGGAFTAGSSRMLFEGRYGATAIVRPYDVSRDGQRFLMVKQKERAPIVAAQMILVHNWFEELKSRVSTK